ncbi:hypothetical protein [Ottowia sp. VDI28]|uniref:hypothetical protein n=1 Tax=Ottowia sp. VDI28 TaxID=3133968 RepID=UPI003C2CA9FE
MIKLTDLSGRELHVAVSSVLRITEAGPSCQYHGIRAYVKTSYGDSLEVTETAAEIARRINNYEVGALQAEIAGHEAANGHLSTLVDELRELLQDAKQAMTELHQAAIPDEDAEGVPAIIPPEAFHKFVDAHAQLCFCMHQRGHNPPKEPQAIAAQGQGGIAA